MTKQYETSITLNTAYGTLEDVPCLCEFTAEDFPRDPEVGDFYPYWEAEVKLSSVSLDGVNFDREQVRLMVGEMDLLTQENTIGERIAIELETGELEYS